MGSKFKNLVAAATRNTNPSILSAVGLVVLADLRVIQYRTALHGGASFLDTLFLAPGLHRQQNATELNNAEYPAVGAMTSGYVFRVENQATVSWLLDIGKTAHLTNVEVSPPSAGTPGTIPSLLYHAGTASTVVVISMLVAMEDWWAVVALFTLMLARLLNVLVIKRRTQMGWKGQPEPGKHGDLIVLLSQDRWVRIRGMIDDLKAVTSGSWLGEMTLLDHFAVNLATILVYLSPALSSNATTTGNLLLGGLLITSAALLGICNAAAKELRMFGRSIKMVGEPKKYDRRLAMANELVEETGRADWAIAMGMIQPPKGKEHHAVIVM